MIHRASRAVAIGIALAAASLVMTSGLLFYRPQPTIDGHFRLLGLHERAEVVRDAFGIPHIFSADLHDLFFLQGYVTAQDRLTQMAGLRATARATASTTARAALGRASPALRDALDAYAAGVTKLIGQYTEARALPGDLVLSGQRPDPWEPVDSLAIVSAYLERVTPASVCASSAPSHTLKGRPIMAADVQLLAPEPGWYEIGLDAAGIRTAGASLPGVPGIAAGHNGWVAWAVLSSARSGSDPAATLGGLLAALPSRSARSFGDALRGAAIAACLADIEGRVGGMDRDQVAFVPADRPGVLGGDGGRGADLVAQLDDARGVGIETMRVVLGRPAPGASGARVVVDLAEVDTSRSAVSHGASGMRGSPHWRDQAAVWEIGQLHRLAFSRAAITRIDGELVLRAR